MMRPSRKISRRDAMKVVGAAIGAAALANLPTQWNKPEIAAGILPAHAQTSFMLICDDDFGPFPIPATNLPVNHGGTLGATVVGAGAGVSVDFQLSADAGITITSSPSTQSGTLYTDASGYVVTPIITIVVNSVPSVLTVTFTLNADSCAQTVSYIAATPFNRNAAPLGESWNDN